VRPKILLVDDHEIVRKGIRELLEGPTREVCGEASNGEEALKKIAELKPDIVVMDNLMPGMSGIQTLRKIREIAPSTKVVILTIDDAISTQAHEAGAVACIHKGSVVAELHQTISRLLIGRKLADGW
jgi:DNA-binding NarL/FixJ family response regulator